jgi:hypothetical protein
MEGCCEHGNEQSVCINVGSGGVNPLIVLLGTRWMFNLLLQNVVKGKR